ncbi:MAG: hypothetical protein LBS19_11660 [Clostridiales bacterium]|nr:hypothetical protein [Clostridiales bacterium]
MKKMIYRGMAALLALVMTGMLAAGCQGGSADEPAAEPGVTVEFMDGESVLKTEEAAPGGTVEAFAPEKEGSVFVGWFATPTMNHVYDFEAPINENTRIFAGFAVEQADVRDFYVVGSGKSSLLVSSSWGNNIADEHKLEKDADANEYSITLDLLAGDQFQFAMNSSWENKRGYGYIPNPADEDGTVYFTGEGGGYGDVNSKGQNITCQVDGNYTLTLTTFPGNDIYDTSASSYTEETKEVYNQGTFDTITWVRNGDVLEAADVITTYYIKGEKITEWADVYSEETGTVQDGALYTLTVTLEEGDVFLFTSQVQSGDIVSVGSEYLRYGNLDEAAQELLTPQNPDNIEGSNMVAISGGTYTFTYNSETDVLSVVLN